MLCNTSSIKWNWMRGQRLFIEEMKGVFTGPCSARSRWPCADFYTPCRAKLQPWATLIAWYTSFSFSLPSLMLSVRSRHQIVLMDVQNNVLTDKNPNTWACDPRDTFSLCVCVIVLGLVHLLIFHRQTPLSLLFTCHHVIGWWKILPLAVHLALEDFFFFFLMEVRLWRPELWEVNHTDLSGWFLHTQSEEWNR